MSILAAELKKEADFLLFKCGIYDTLKEIGKVYFTGSYELDVMVWPDIDIYLVTPKSKNIITELGIAAGKLIANYDRIVTVKVERDYCKRLASCPPGQYLQLKIETDSFDCLWKVDIWVIPQQALQKKLYETEDFLKHMTKDKRNLILECKQRLKGDNFRTPSFSSYHVYKAVLQKKITNITDIIDYVGTKIKFKA
ncbi:MAG TPA: hypothetical protein QF753_18325 [Victivallales bacterium]|nr:hypothetical protein [Victivallales bacterium]